MGEDVDRIKYLSSRAVKIDNNKVNKLLKQLNDEVKMLHKNVLDVNIRKSNFVYLPFINDENNEIDYCVIFNNGSLWSKKVEYIKFLDYKGKNLFVSRKEHTIDQLKAYARYASEINVTGKVIEIDKGQMFIIGDYVSKVKGDK